MGSGHRDVPLFRKTEDVAMNQLQGLVALIVPICLGGAVFAAETAVTYDQARWDPIHFKPAIDSATNAQCLACHQEVIDRRVLEASPAGVQAQQTTAWYQTLDTYTGEQETFHRRHLVTDFAQQLMQLKCNTCHQGNDPREETANSSATGQSDLIQRKQVDPDICLMCHGQFNYQVMGVPGGWLEHGKLFGDSCLTCHVAIRTTRHQVNFLKPEAIEEAGKQSSDSCYGCHGGRAWYRIPYPYPRHAWPGAGETAPDWAKDRPTQSDPRFAVPTSTAAAQ
jgi:hypothetical protein